MGLLDHAFGDDGTLGLWVFGIIGLGYHWYLGPWDLGLYDFGIMGVWDFGTM